MPTPSTSTSTSTTSTSEQLIGTPTPSAPCRRLRRDPSHLVRPPPPLLSDLTSRWAQEWNRAYLLACAAGLIVDPLFFYSLSISSPLMCVFIDGWFAITITLLRCMTDSLHVWNACLHFKAAFRRQLSPPEDDGEAGKPYGTFAPPTLAYLKSKKGFLLDLFVILPIMQIVMWVAAPALIREGHITTVMAVLLIMFLFQYIPKIYHSVCFLRRTQNFSGYIFGTIWWGIALNLIVYFVASHMQDIFDNWDLEEFLNREDEPAQMEYEPLGEQIQWENEPPTVHDELLPDIIPLEKDIDTADSMVNYYALLTEPEVEAPAIPQIQPLILPITDKMIRDLTKQIRQCMMFLQSLGPVAKSQILFDVNFAAHSVLDNYFYFPTRKYYDQPPPRMPLKKKSPRIRVRPPPKGSLLASNKKEKPLRYWNQGEPARPDYASSMGSN